MSLLLTGCKGNDTRPDRPAVMGEAEAADSLLRYTTLQFEKDKAAYDKALGEARDASDPADAKRKYEAATLQRDVMINRIRADIRDHSGEFEDMLRQRIAEWATGADFVELGLAAATTIVGGEQAKTVLAAILTAVKGGRISVDKNFFRERTSEAIISALRSTRLKQDSVIVRKMTGLDVRRYTFEEAWNDLVDLYYAGTLASGFQTLAEQAAAKADQARNESDAAQRSRVWLVPADVELIERRRRLTEEFDTMDDARKRKVLAALGLAITEETDVGAMLQRQMDAIEAVEADIARMEDAFKKTRAEGGQ